MWYSSQTCSTISHRKEPSLNHITSPGTPPFSEQIIWKDMPIPIASTSFYTIHGSCHCSQTPSLSHHPPALQLCLSMSVIFRLQIQYHFSVFILLKLSATFETTDLSIFPETPASSYFQAPTHTRFSNFPAGLMLYLVHFSSSSWYLNIEVSHGSIANFPLFWLKPFCLSKFIISWVWIPSTFIWLPVTWLLLKPKIT